MSDDEYVRLKAERQRLRALLDAQPKSRQHLPVFKQVQAQHDGIQQKIKDIFRKQYGSTNI